MRNKVDFLQNLIVPSLMFFYIVLTEGQDNDFQLASIFIHWIISITVGIRLWKQLAIDVQHKLFENEKIDCGIACECRAFNYFILYYVILVEYSNALFNILFTTIYSTKKYCDLFCKSAINSLEANIQEFSWASYWNPRWNYEWTTYLLKFSE